MDNPKIAFPLRLAANGKTLVHHEQDSEAEIMDCVEVLVRTPLGSRIEVPDYGVPDQAFNEGSADAEEIIQAIELWEPRAPVDIERQPLEGDGMIDRLKLRIEGRAG